MAQTEQQPKASRQPQHQEKPGIESCMQPRPHYRDPLYKAAGKLASRRR